MRALIETMNQVFLQLGSNMGERHQYLSSAISLIEEKIGAVESASKIYESTPWRVDGQENYLNQVLLVKSNLSSLGVLHEALQIENELGRVRLEKWGERIIDVDIIFYNDEMIETAELCIPHKHMHERLFVLLPLVEIAPDFIHPKYRKTIIGTGKRNDSSIANPPQIE